MKWVLTAILISVASVAAATLVLKKAMPHHLFDPESWFVQD